MAFLGWLVGAALFTLCAFLLHLLSKYVISYRCSDMDYREDDR